MHDQSHDFIMIQMCGMYDKDLVHNRLFPYPTEHVTHYQSGREFREIACHNKKLMHYNMHSYKAGAIAELLNHYTIAHLSTTNNTNRVIIL